MSTDGSGVRPLRRKDLALLVFLRLDRVKVHSRSYLTGLLWDDDGDERGRHSLSQALGRLRVVCGAAAIALVHDTVEWRGELPCDAALDDPLVGAAAGRSVPVPHPSLFVAHFELGTGAQNFALWAEGYRAALCAAMVRRLERSGAEAEREGRWADARDLALLAIEVEPLCEEAHRRAIRAWSALGERMLALRHYDRFAAWLAAEWSEQPDPATRELTADLRAGRLVHR